MTATLNALIPILTLIALGYLLRRMGFLADAFWPSAEKLAYYLLLPILLIQSLATKNFSGLPWQAMLAAVYVPLLITAALLIAGRRWIDEGDNAKFTSIFQGGIRFNTYIGLALAAAFFGGEGIAIGALIAGLMIVLVNVMCVAVLAVSIPAERRPPGRVVVVLAKNPLILSCLIGAALNLTGLAPKGPVLDTMKIVGDTALPLGLICVGASLQWNGVLGHLRAAGISSVAQFGVKPLLAAVCCAALAIPAPISTVAVMFLALPTAPSSYILARQMGGDHRLMASIVTLQTIAAFITLSVTFRILGLI